MTERLYYNDPYRQQFDGTVIRAEVHQSRPVVLLDRSAFYPSSGGQPADIGRLGDARVVDVFDDEEGNVWHVVAADSVTLNAGERVHGTIDWPRRFDHMQQHTGQHVLSAAFDRRFGARTVSFHLGTELSTIDLARELTPDQLCAGEDEANRIVWEDRPVSIRYVTEDEASRLPLRKEPARGGTLRIIEIEGCDLSACGGTHVSRTGAIGIIAVTAWERFKGGQRLTFACGGRALVRHRLLRDVVVSAGRLLSAVPADLTLSVERLQNELKESRRARQALETELASYRAAALVEAAVEGAQSRVIARIIDDDANGLKALAAAAVATPGLTVALISASSPITVVVARSGDVAVSSTDVVAALTGRFGGRGGGRTELAQAGGLDASPELILDTIRGILSVKP